MSYNPYNLPPQLPPFGNFAGLYCPPQPPPGNFYPPRFNAVDISRPPPPFMVPANRPPIEYHAPRFSPTVPPPMPQTAPFRSEMFRVPPPMLTQPPMPTQFVPFNGTPQFPPRPVANVSQFPGQRMPYNCPSATPSFTKNWTDSSPSFTRAEWTPAANANRQSNNANRAWPVKRQHSEQTEGTNKQTKKMKISKRDLPENNAFYCDRCDRGFKTLDKLKEHTDQHVKCRVEGCGYIAAQKLVQLHFEFQHKTGLAKKIWTTASKEEENNWILERKRNYPTAENKERKRKELAERRARGDVLDNRYFGKMRGRGGNCRGRGSWRGGYRHSNNCDDNEQLKMENSTEDSKLEQTGPIVTSTVCDAAVVSDTLEPDSSNNANSDAQSTATVQSSVCKNMSPTEDQLKSATRVRKQKATRANRKSTLLEKLLAPEIRHERNVILQCVRFVVEHFGIRQSLPSTTICKENLPLVANEQITNEIPVSAATTGCQEQPLAAGSAENDSKEAECNSVSSSKVLPDGLLVSSDAPEVASCTLVHGDGADGDSGIGSPARIATSGILEDECKVD